MEIEKLIYALKKARADGSWNTLSDLSHKAANALEQLQAEDDRMKEEVQIQKEAMERMGWFGKMFQRYKGDPRGPIGTPGGAAGKFLVEFCIATARNRQVLKDVDGNTWLPMLQDEFRAMADFIERVQGWIPVEERLPEEEGIYIVCVDGEVKSDAYCVCDGVERWLCYNGTVCSVDFDPYSSKLLRDGPYPRVTHWMPLPKPPKEETHEK